MKNIFQCLSDVSGFVGQLKDNLTQAIRFKGLFKKASHLIGTTFILNETFFHNQVIIKAAGKHGAPLSAIHRTSPNYGFF